MTCICLCSALDNSLGPLARESPCSFIPDTKRLFNQKITITQLQTGVIAYRGLHDLNLCDGIMGNMMGATCDKYGGDEKCLENFGTEI